MTSHVPKLTSDEWYVYLCLNRYVGVAELAAMTGFSEADIDLHLATLQEQDLITRLDHRGTALYRRTSASAPESLDSGGATLSAQEVAEEERLAAAGDPSTSDEERLLPGPVPAPGAAPAETGAESATPPARTRVSTARIALALAVILALASVVLLVGSRDPDPGSASPTDSATDVEDTGPGGTEPTAQSPTTPDDTASSAAPGPPELRLPFSSYSGEPFESVPIQGTYAGAEAGTVLRVQRREDGEWVDFPLPAVTGEDGSFRTFVQLGAGRYRVRLADPGSDVVSDEIVLRIG